MNRWGSTDGELKSVTDGLYIYTSRVKGKPSSDVIGRGRRGVIVRTATVRTGLAIILN